MGVAVLGLAGILVYVVARHPVEGGLTLGTMVVAGFAAWWIGPYVERLLNGRD